VFVKPGPCVTVATPSLPETWAKPKAAITALLSVDVGTYRPPAAVRKLSTMNRLASPTTPNIT